MNVVLLHSNMVKTNHMSTLENHLEHAIRLEIIYNGDKKPITTDSLVEFPISLFLEIRDLYDLTFTGIAL